MDIYSQVISAAIMKRKTLKIIGRRRLPLSHPTLRAGNPAEGGGMSLLGLLVVAAIDAHGHARGQPRSIAMTASCASEARTGCC
jgi:hypothetical protein